MYLLPHFTEQDNARVLQFLKDHPFVMLVGNEGGNSVATQVPVLVEERGDKLILRGHIMRGTDHYKAFEANNKALVLFTGAHCYVSSSWYNERNIGSTWNYMTVYAKGEMKFTTDDETVQLLTDLTHKYEDGHNPNELVENMPPEYINAMVKAIAGFEIEVQELHPIFKLSQNRSDESYKNIVAQLQAGNDQQANEIAEEMIGRRPNLFDK